MNKAVVFVDVQKDFVKGGKLEFGYPIEDNLQKVVDFAKECVDAYCNDSTALARIYATRDTHEATELDDAGCKSTLDALEVGKTPTFHIKITGGYLATLEGQKLPIEHCVEGTDGWQIVDPLMEVLLGKATFVNKPTFGSYDLVEIIEEDFGKNGPNEIIICGYDLSICCLANAVLLRAKFPNTKITVKTDLCGDVDKMAFDAAVKVLQMQQIDVE